MVLFFSQNSYANVVWPGLYLSGRMITWAIPAGILLEVFLLKYIIQRGWGYTLLVTSVANIISTIVGAVGAILGNL